MTSSFVWIKCHKIRPSALSHIDSFRLVLPPISLTFACAENWTFTPILSFRPFEALEFSTIVYFCTWCAPRTYLVPRYIYSFLFAFDSDFMYVRVVFSFDALFFWCTQENTMRKWLNPAQIVDVLSTFDSFVFNFLCWVCFFFEFVRFVFAFNWLLCDFVLKLFCQHKKCFCLGQLIGLFQSIIVCTCVRFKI